MHNENDLYLATQEKHPAQARNTQQKRNPKKPSPVHSEQRQKYSSSPKHTLLPHDNKKPKPTHNSQSQLTGIPKTLHN